MADAPESAKDAQGRLKEAAGGLTGNDELKRQGQAEQAGEKLKSGIDKVADKAKAAVDR